MKKIAEHIIFALGIGFMATTACLWIFGLNKASGAEVMRQFTTWLAASVLYGLISLIYDSDLPPLFSIAIHFIGCAVITFIASYVSGIFSLTNCYEWFLYVLPVFIVLYLIIGAAITLTQYCSVKKINKKINNK